MKFPVNLASATRLGTSQTLAWASSDYLPAMLAAPMASEFDVSSSGGFAAFFVALVISAALGPFVGRRIDSVGGRGMLMAFNLVLATGLVLMTLSQGMITLFDSNGAGVLWLT